MLMMFLFIARVNFHLLFSTFILRRVVAAASFEVALLGTFLI